MKKWVLKAIVQKLISILPFSFKLNYFFQRYITKAVVISEEFFETILTHFQEMDEYSDKHNFSIKDKTVLELGTGWHPIAPLCFFLSGAKEIVTVDLRGLMRESNLKDLIQKFLGYYDNQKLKTYAPNIQEDRIDILRKLDLTDSQLTAENILEILRIKQRIGFIQEFDFKGQEFDFIYSINVMEHVDEEHLPPIVNAFTKIQKQGSLAYHAIGVYDHFSHIDSTISKFNYLRFSKKQWKRIDNDVQPQNRLRISYFRDLFLKNQYQVLDELFQKAEPEGIKMIKIHPDFANVPELDIPYGTFILQRNNA